MNRGRSENITSDDVQRYGFDSVRLKVVSTPSTLVVVVELGGEPVPVSDPLGKMIATATRENIRAVFLAGREVALDNELLWKRAQPVIERLQGNRSR